MKAERLSPEIPYMRQADAVSKAEGNISYLDKWVKKIGDFSGVEEHGMY